MKKVLLMMLLALTFYNISAQECDLCGTWIGTSKVFLSGDDTVQKTYIKIKKYGEKYTIRVKQVYTDNNQSKTNYWNDCTNVYVNGNIIGWRSFSHQVDENDDGHWKHNGRIIDVAKYYYVCTATFDNGILYFSQKVEGEFIGRDGGIIGKYDQPPYPIKELYKEEDDW